MEFTTGTPFVSEPCDLYPSIENYLNPNCSYRVMEWKCLNCKKTHNDYPYIAKKRKYCNATCQLEYEYKTKKRDKFKTGIKAREVIRKYGQPKHKGKPVAWLSSPNADKIKKKISIAKTGSKNNMYGKKPWNKKTPTSKWWEEKEFIELRKKCLERDEYKCVNCGEKDKELYCDHIIPYRQVKNHKLENLQMLCGSCHSKKTNSENLIYIQK